MECFVQSAQFSLGGKIFSIDIKLTALHLGLAVRVRHRTYYGDLHHHPQADERWETSPGVGSVLLGHVTMVFRMAVLLATGGKTIVGPVKDNSSSLHHCTALVDNNPSRMLLYRIALLDVIILIGMLAEGN